MMGYRFFIFVFAFLLGIGLIGYIFTDVFIYLLSAIVLSSILKQAVNMICQLELYGHRLPRWLAVTALMLGIISGITYGLTTAIPILVNQVTDISKADVTALINRINKPILQIEASLSSGGFVDIKPGYAKSYLKEISNLDFKKGDLAHFVENLINLTSSVMVSLLAVSFMTFFLLLDPGLLKRAFLQIVPNNFFELTITTFYKIEQLLSGYLIGLASQMIVIFTLSLIGFWLIGLQYVVTIALFAAIINIIPYFGPLLSNGTALIVGLATIPGISSDDYPYYGAQILGVGLFVHLADNIVIEPFIFSRSLKAHPLEIFIAIFAGSSVGGLIGMVAALPVYTILRSASSQIISGYRDYRVFKVRPRLPSLPST